MKTLKLKLFVSIIVLIFNCLDGLSAKEVRPEMALQIARKCVDSNFPSNIMLNPDNIRLQNSYKTDWPFYVFDVDGSGFVLVARDDRCPSILGFSFSRSFPSNLDRAPESILSYFKGLKIACEEFIRNGGYNQDDMRLTVKSRNEKPEKSQKIKFIPALMTTKWRVDSSFCSEFPDGSMASASAPIAMGQVFRYFEYPKYGFGQYCYLFGKEEEEICGTFEDYSLNFDQMPNESANVDVANLLFFMAVCCRLQPGGADMITFRETLPAHFMYSTNMKKIEYWEYNFIPVIKHQLMLNRPVPAEWKGHYFVIDGYYDTDFFHFNLGMGGEFDGYYFMDFPKVTADKDHFILNCFINYHPLSLMPAPNGLDLTVSGDSLNISWNLNLPDSLSQEFDKFVILRDGVVPIIETVSNSVMIHPQDLGISSDINCIAVYKTRGASELSEAVKYISDLTIANIPSLELRQAINIQLGYKENLNREPFVGELEMVKKLEVDFQDQRGIDQLKNLRHLFIDGLFLTKLKEGEYLSSLNYLMFHRCKQFDFTVLENANSLNVIQGSDGLPYDFYDLRHNSDAGVISFATHDAVMNNCCDLFGADQYFQNLTLFDLYHLNYIFYDSCYVSYESYRDILPRIKGGAAAIEHTSPSSYAPCYPIPERFSNQPNTTQVSWQANFDEDDNVFYNVYIGKTRDQLPLVAPFYTGTTYEYDFENNLDYYWRIEAFHNDTTYYSGIYQFSTYEGFQIPYMEDFDNYFAKCDVSEWSPLWLNFGDELSQPAKTSRLIKKSGRYSMEFGIGSDGGFVIDNIPDSSYILDFYFKNDKAEFGIELLQKSIDGDTLAVNSTIGLFGDNLATFDFGESSEQFFFVANEWNHAKINLNMISKLGTLIINEEEISSWNWNVQKDGAANSNPFQGVRFSNAGATGSAFIDDIGLWFSGSMGVQNIVQKDWPTIRYSPLHHELLIEQTNMQITDVDLIDLRGRKIITFACNGQQRLRLDDSIPNGVFVVKMRSRDGAFISKRISLIR